MAGAAEVVAALAGGCASELGADDGFSGCEAGDAGLAEAADGAEGLEVESAFADPAGVVVFRAVSNPERGRPSRRQRSHPNPATRASATTSRNTQPLLDFGSSSSSSK